MNYITVLQLSGRWNVTPRYIQNLCRDGRLAGAERFGKSWIIPEDVERPADCRRKNAAEPLKPFTPPDEKCYSVIVTSYRIAGTADTVTNSLSDNPEAAKLTTAQFAYLRGDIPTAKSISENLTQTSQEFEIKAGASFLLGIAAMYSGDILGWQNAKSQIETLPCPDGGCQAKKEFWLAALGSTIYDMSAYPEWFRRGCFDSLPFGYYPAARVHYIKYLYIIGDSIVKNQPFQDDKFSKQLFVLPAICEPLISQTAAEKAVVSEIYLRLLCASSYHHAGKDGYAVAHIDRAVDIALPDRIYAPFAEQRLNLDSLIDERLKLRDTEAYEKVRTLNAQLMNGWSVLHNRILHTSHTNELSAKELEAARLAVFGLTNSEVAERMGISINSVKNYLRSAMFKTGAEKRSELANFI